MATRLMSPSDLGEHLRPFVFLDHFDTLGAPQPESSDYGLHPHSGIATASWLFEGSVNYEDTLGRRGRITHGGLEWMKAGGGAWHGGNLGGSERVRGFQLWIALPPAQELEEAESRDVTSDEIETDGPATVLLGSYGEAVSAVLPPSPINYLAVNLKAGEKWRYQPPQSHTVAWAAVSIGGLVAPDGLSAGEMAAFEESTGAIDFEAKFDTEFVLGSAAKHEHDLVLGYYSVHTSAAALREGEARIVEIGTRLRAEGRLRRR
jgi:redox-sensitive bicupin YhaK (pirin superfamily)